MLGPLVTPLPPADYWVAVLDNAGGLVVRIAVRGPIERARKVAELQLAQQTGRASVAKILDRAERPVLRFDRSAKTMWHSREAADGRQTPAAGKR